MIFKPEDTLKVTDRPLSTVVVGCSADARWRGVAADVTVIDCLDVREGQLRNRNRQPVVVKK